MQVTWIYPDINQPIGVGEATVPQVQKFFKELGISIEDMILNVNANLKIGAKFENWSRTQDYFFHPFGDTDIKCLELEWMLDHNKVTPDIVEKYPDLATNFDVKELCNWLDKKFKEFNNLTILRKTITDASEIEDDHIVDATGFSKVLINKNNKDNFKSIRDIIPNNRAWVYRAQYSDIDKQQVPYTTLTAVTHGWIWTIPLKDVITFGHVYDDKYDTKQEYIDFVESRLGYKIDQSKIADIKMITGRNIEHVRQEGSKTIYSVGLSSYFIEPLEATGLYLSMYGIRLLDRLLHRDINAEIYNDLYNNEFDAVTEFISSYYIFSKNTNEYWDHYKSLKIQKHRPNGIFPGRSWNLILSGMGEEERKYKLDYRQILKVKKESTVTYSDWLRKQHERH